MLTALPDIGNTIQLLVNELITHLISQKFKAIRNKKYQMRKSRRHLKIMIIEDEYDILLLYKDYLAARGHQILATATTTGNIIADYEMIHPDITLVDYKLPGNSSGLDLARQILQISPTAAILLITAYDSVTEQIVNDPTFKDKRFAVLIKPTKLRTLESTIYNLIDKDSTTGLLIG